MGCREGQFLEGVFQIFVYAPSRAFSLDMAFSSTFMQMTHLYVPVKPTES